MSFVAVRFCVFTTFRPKLLRSRRKLNESGSFHSLAAEQIVGAATSFRLCASIALKGYGVESAVWLNFVVRLDDWKQIV
jgi:hypothetical protein